MAKLRGCPVLRRVHVNGRRNLHDALRVWIGHAGDAVFAHARNQHQRPLDLLFGLGLDLRRGHDEQAGARERAAVLLGRLELRRVIVKREITRSRRIYVPVQRPGRVAAAGGLGLGVGEVRQPVGP